MRYTLTLIIALLAINSTAAVYSHAQSMIRGKIVDVYDGDTMTMNDFDGNRGLKIRLCGINAPEIRGKEIGAVEARDFLDDLVFGERISCEIVGEQSNTPCKQKNARSFGRIVAQCFIKGEDVAEILVDKGHAMDDPEYSRGHYKK